MTPDQHAQRCQLCRQPLKPGTEVYLEMDTRTGRYGEDIDPEHSQGAFPFGKACARKILRKRG